MSSENLGNSSRSSESFLTSMLTKFRLRSRRRVITYSIMVVGLDNCGKTSLIELISKLAPQPTSNQSTSTNNSGRSTPDTTGRVTVQCRPTVGYNFDFIRYNNWVGLNVLDFSGNTRYRDLWQEFYCAVDAIVFVIDSSDPIRFVVARDELDTMLSYPFFNSLGSNPKSNQLQFDTKPDIRMSNNVFLPDNRFPQVEYQKALTILNGKLVESPLDTSNQAGRNGARAGLRNLRTKIPILFLANKSDLSSSVDVATITNALNLSKLNTQRHPWHIQSTSVNSGDGVQNGLSWLIGVLGQEDQ